MLTSFQSVLLMLTTVVVAVAFLFALNRAWKSDLRRQHNELIGWNVGVLGSTYAVIVGFMLFAVWTNFETADADTDAEANCLVNLVHFSRGLSNAPRTQVLSLAKEYINIMLTKEWPAMSRGQVSPASHACIRRLWATLSAIEPKGGSDQLALDHTLTEFARMSDYRRMRQLQVDAYLPGILWLVLILGAVVTIISACLFGTSDFRLHLVQVVMLSLMISSVLVAIADINHPFQGSLHVSPAGFERARDTLADLP